MAMRQGDAGGRHSRLNRGPRRRADFDRVAEEVCPPDSVAEEHGTEATVAEFLAWVALVKAPANPKLISCLGRIRDGEVDELSLELAPRISAATLSLQDEFVKHANRRSWKWWKHQRKGR